MTGDPTEPPGRGDTADREVRRLERLMPEVIKRIIEAGYEKLAEGPENVRQLVGDLKLPKEALALILSQIDDTKTGVYRVVAKEIRDFLDHTNFAEEMVKVLTTLSFEVKTEVRFIPNEARNVAVPDVRAKVRVRRSSRPSTIPPPPGAPSDSPPPPSGHPESHDNEADHRRK